MHGNTFAQNSFTDRTRRKVPGKGASHHLLHFVSENNNFQFSVAPQVNTHSFHKVVLDQSCEIITAISPHHCSDPIMAGVIFRRLIPWNDKLMELDSIERK